MITILSYHSQSKQRSNLRLPSKHSHRRNEDIATTNTHLRGNDIVQRSRHKFVSNQIEPKFGTILPQIDHPNNGYPDVYDMIVSQSAIGNTEPIGNILWSHWQSNPSRNPFKSYKYPFHSKHNNLEDIPYVSKYFLHGRHSDPLQNLNINKGFGIDYITSHLHDDQLQERAFQRLYTCQLISGFCDMSIGIAISGSWLSPDADPESGVLGYLVLFEMPESSQLTCHQSKDEMECYNNPQWCIFTHKALQTQCKLRMVRVYRMIQYGLYHKVTQNMYHAEMRGMLQLLP